MLQPKLEAKTVEVEQMKVFANAESERPAMVKEAVEEVAATVKVDEAAAEEQEVDRVVDLAEVTPALNDALKAPDVRSQKGTCEGKGMQLAMVPVKLVLPAVGITEDIEPGEMDDGTGKMVEDWGAPIG